MRSECLTLEVLSKLPRNSLDLSEVLKTSLRSDWLTLEKLS